MSAIQPNGLLVLINLTIPPILVGLTATRPNFFVKTRVLPINMIIGDWYAMQLLFLGCFLGLPDGPSLMRRRWSDPQRCWVRRLSSVVFGRRCPMVLKIDSIYRD